jgi:hypothetical protein
VARLRGHLADFERTPLREGLARTIEWFLVRPHLIDGEFSSAA